VYDINFKESIDMLNYYGYFEKIIEELANMTDVTPQSINIVKENILPYKI